METGVLVTVAGFVLGLAYHTGRLSARVEHIERWRQELLADMHAIRESIGTVARHVNGKERS